MIEKDRYWLVTLSRGGEADLKTPAGTFHCRAVKLSPKLPDGSGEERFRGLFGIHGTLSIWLDEGTGVPVRIEGLVPIGPLELDVALSLSAFEGTPEAFAPIN